MKKTEKKKPVQTMPKGVWESPHADEFDDNISDVKNIVKNLQVYADSGSEYDSRREAEGKKK
ncbi:MAG: hypothetical protein J1E62_01065 [Lachnospiraceae bacterium]|nr:hypothetical protein [Lachnospiraceae bacterium]